MGKVAPPPSGTPYVDSNSVIYHVERSEPYWSAGLPLWEALDEGRSEVVTSELTLLEVLVKPLRDGAPTLATLYRTVLLASGLSCLPIDRSILETAAQLRADYRLRTPDAIHAATALHEGASLFLTNDAEFRKVPGLNVVLLGEVAASESD